MQGFTYENQGQNTYLVYQFDDRPIDTMALGMLTNNKIKGFAPAIYTEIDNQIHQVQCVVTCNAQ